MGNRIKRAAASLWVLAAGFNVLNAAVPDPPQPDVTRHKESIEKYCVTCHNERLKTGGLVLAGLDLSKASANADIWEKVVRKLRTNAMPPPGMPQPDPAARQSLIAFFENQLDHAAAANPNPGRPVLHRLNRAEYANAIRDLLALDIDAASLLPPDDAAYGFDNISDALGLSPALQEHYLSAALKIGALAVGDPHVTPGSELYRIRQDLSQNQHIEGMPLGTIGGTRVLYNFPLDGEYILQAKLFRTNLNIVRGLSTVHQVEFAIDGQRVRLATFGGPQDLAALFEKPTDTGDAVDARLRVQLPVKAGPHEVTAAFVQGPMVEVPDRLQPYIRSSVDNFDWAGLPHIQTFAITGPFHVTGSGDTPSRHRIFTCRPANAAAEAACAKQIVSTLARRAYRQPVTDEDLKRLMSFYEANRRNGNFEAGVESALQRILASPKFVFRVERDPSNLPPVHRIADIELASRLSFFLWSSIPDDELLNVAGQGMLRNPAVLERQVRRMLVDPKAEALVANFAGQWLHLRNVPNILPNSDLFPDFDDNLRQSLRRETELLFQSIIHEDRGVLDLLTADYTFVNERLARYYGIPDIYGSRFRRIAIADDARKGLLGQGSILAVTSHAERTSPVVRGKFILENILGTPVPPPPPDVPALKETAAGEKPKTMREQMAEHRANPACATCHKVMDPIGFALENFDAVGAWRTREAGTAIDASGQLADGTRVDGVVTLRQALVRNPELFASTLTEKLLTYGLGRGLDYYDMPAVRAIVRDSAPGNYKFSAIVMGIVRSTPFQMRAAPDEGQLE
jgi:mono/diheme cytochrome c family protein